MMTSLGQKWMKRCEWIHAYFGRSQNSTYGALYQTNQPNTATTTDKVKNMNALSCYKRFFFPLLNGKSKNYPSFYLFIALLVTPVPHASTVTI